MNKSLVNHLIWYSSSCIHCWISMLMCVLVLSTSLSNKILFLNRNKDTSIFRVNIKEPSNCVSLLVLWQISTRFAKIMSKCLLHSSMHFLVLLLYIFYYVLLGELQACELENIFICLRAKFSYHGYLKMYMVFSTTLCL